MSLWIVVGNRHPKLKAGTYVRLYTDHFRVQRIIPTPGHRFKTEDVTPVVEYTVPDLEAHVFPVGQKQNLSLFKSALGHAYFRTQDVKRPASQLILPGDEEFHA